VAITAVRFAMSPTMDVRLIELQVGPLLNLVKDPDRVRNASFTLVSREP